MARGRMISKVISLDEKVNALSDDTCRLLFTWLITHLDCEGRIYGDAQAIKSIVFPRRNISVRKIENYLKELESCRLIFRYSVNGNQYLWMKNFEKHQTGLRKDRESPSQIPPFSPELRRTEDGKSLAQVKDKVEVKDEQQTEVKEKEIAVSLSSVSIEEVITAYQDNILRGATASEEMDDELRTACTRYSPEWVLDAIKEALVQNQPTWRYMFGILRNWQRYGKVQG